MKGRCSRRVVDVADRTLVVVPTYNERENVPRLIAEIQAVAPDVDVLIVDDNSPDGTAELTARAFKERPSVSVLRRHGPRGLGRSYVDGYRTALDRGYGRLVQMDADFSHDPRSIAALVHASLTADVVIGSRYCPGGRVENWRLWRRLLSRFANTYVRAIARVAVHDSTSGFRCYTFRALLHLVNGEILAEGYAFLVEATYRLERNGLRIVEIPITFTDRREGQSKISRKAMFESMLLPWRLRLKSELRPALRRS